jgi:hypothetical protein
VPRIGFAARAAQPSVVSAGGTNELAGALARILAAVHQVLR